MYTCTCCCSRRLHTSHSHAALSIHTHVTRPLTFHTWQSLINDVLTKDLATSLARELRLTNKHFLAKPVDLHLHATRHVHTHTHTRYC